jgi:hypothetical protein
MMVESGMASCFDGVDPEAIFGIGARWEPSKSRGFRRQSGLASRGRGRSSTRRPPYSMRISARPAAPQRLVDALARQAHQVAQLLLRDAQQLAHARVQHRVEQRARLRATRVVGVVQAVDLARGDELAQPLVQLHHHEAVEADAAVEQPVEGGDRDAGHDAVAQRLDVVAVDLALEHRAFAEPAAGRHAGEGDRHAQRRVVAHLQQAVEHAEPVGHRPADAAHQSPGLDLHHAQVGDDAARSVVVERASQGCRAARAGADGARARVRPCGGRMRG